MVRQVLQPIADLEFHPRLHRYRYKGRWLPFSVSKVANKTNAYQEQQFKETQHLWAPRGNDVHAFCESLLLKQDLPDTEYPEWTQALQECWLFNDCKTMAAEYRLCDARKGVGGSFDFLLQTQNGKIVLGDLKTVGNKTAVDRRQPAKTQLGGYLAMLIDHHPMLTVDWCYTVVVGPNCCKLLQNEPNECLSSWVDAWDAFRLKNCPF